MKNYIIGALVCIILALGTLLYKSQANERKTLSIKFPLEIGKAGALSKSNKNPQIHIYVFFSKESCHDCLGIVDVLNILSPTHFLIKGVVPEGEYSAIEEIRGITGATFPIESDRKFRGLIPRYSPAIVGLSKKSDLFFVIPGVPGEKEYLDFFLNSLYNKVYPYLVSLE